MSTETKLTKKLHMSALQNDYELLSLMFTDSNASIGIFRNGQVIFVNRAFAQTFGFEKPKLIIGLSMDSLFIDEAVPGKGNTCITYGVSASGAKFSLHLEFTQIVLPSGPAQMGIIVSNLGMVKTQQELLHLAMHDSLTGLPNRSLFYDRLQHAFAKCDRTGNQLALMFVDLVKFKDINDTFGHTIGDELLKRIALRFTSAARQSDTVARLSGDEFTILLEDVFSKKMIKDAAERILAAVSRPYQLGTKTIRVGLSIGIAVYPDDAERLDDLVRCADIAMYIAKSAGRKSIKFYSKELLQVGDRPSLHKQVGNHI